jgi:flagellar hook-associated protein 3 FlgL
MVSRISTNAIFDRMPANMSAQQVQLQRTQDQMSSGKRILKPSDDPSGAARVIDMSYAIQKVNQIAENQKTAKTSLDTIESNMESAINLIQNVLEESVRIGDGTLSQQDYRSIALTARSAVEELRGIANSTDSEGKFIFSGFSTDTLPFANIGGEIVYQGDEGQRLAQVGFSRRMPINDPGSQIFMGALSGNGMFEVTENPANTGEGRFGDYTIKNSALLTGHQYKIAFSDVAGVRSYSVTDETLGGTPVGATAPYTPGQAITFDGVQVTMNGKAAAGDSFNVNPSSAQSLFKTLTDMATAIETPTATDAERARVANQVAALRQNLNQALSHVADARSNAGSRRAEIDTLEVVIADSQMVHQQQLADVQELDYPEAVSRLAKQKLVLEASQLSYAKIAQKTNLFDLMK